MNACTVADCGNVRKYRELCGMHYQRLHKTGSLDYAPPTPAQRFFAKVNKTEACWIWTGATQADGYGRFFVAAGEVTNAHRYAFELLVGPIPDGLVLDHLCRVKSCVNPDHLQAVTVAENNRRGVGFAGQHRKTHCIRGHEFTPENTYRHPKRGTRTCRECMRIWKANRKAAA